ncbi:MAG: hypothetical protein QGG39_08470 [Candidatus Poribacteria bacterium]|nr:hypothetical protein [Candidatus Poribacteria bacterium]
MSEGISKSNEKTRESRRLAGRTERKNNSVIDRLDSGRLVDNGMPPDGRGVGCTDYRG